MLKKCSVVAIVALLAIGLSAVILFCPPASMSRI